MIRRTFLASLSGSALALSPAQSNFEHRETAGEVILGNGVLRLTFDRASGALVRLENRPAGKLLAIAPSAAAPVRLWLGSRTQPDEAVLMLARSVSQKCHWQTVEVDGDLSIVVHYEDLTHAGRGTGIALTQTYTISLKSDFVRLQTTIENRGAWWITGVFLGLESLSLNAEGSRERLVTGGVSSAPIMDPRHAIPAGSAYVKYPAGRRSFSVPPTVPTNLMLTWMDYSDDQWGLGTCYLDRSDMDLVGDVRAEPDGLALAGDYSGSRAHVRSCRVSMAQSKSIRWHLENSSLVTSGCLCFTRETGTKRPSHTGSVTKLSSEMISWTGNKHPRRSAPPILC